MKVSEVILEVLDQCGFASQNYIFSEVNRVLGRKINSEILRLIILDMEINGFIDSSLELHPFGGYSIEYSRRK